MGGVVLAGSVGSNNLHRSLNFGTRSLFKTNLMFVMKLLIKRMHSSGVNVDLNFELDCCNLSCNWFEFNFICFTLANFRSAPPTSYVKGTRFYMFYYEPMTIWFWHIIDHNCSYIFHDAHVVSTQTLATKWFQPELMCSERSFLLQHRQFRILVHYSRLHFSWMHSRLHTCCILQNPLCQM